jgi:hypothetical protein
MIFLVLAAWQGWTWLGLLAWIWATYRGFKHMRSLIPTPFGDACVTKPGKRFQSTVSMERSVGPIFFEPTRYFPVSENDTCMLRIKVIFN